MCHDSRECPDDFHKEVPRHLSAVHAFALGLTGDTDEAADLVQETCCRALRYWHTYEAETNCRTWLFRTCQRQFYRRWRSERRRPDRRRLGSFEDVRPGVSSWLVSGSRPGNPARDLSIRLLVEEVEAALARMPVHYRAPLRLRLVEELTYDEIASALGLCEGTVKSRLNRGRTLLQREMAAT